jgi:PEGA domain
MKIKLNLIFLSIFVYVSLMIQPLSVFAELIEPSRTMDGQQKPMGRLSVFSEPPELDVYLDDTKIGKTPVISKEVTPGVHILRIKDTEKEITILSGKSLQLSLFKDSLIKIPEKKAKAPAQPKLEQKMASEEKKPDEPTKEKTKNEPKYDPPYWPLNPTGPIR